MCGWCCVISAEDVDSSLWYAAGIGVSGTMTEMGVPFVEDRVVGREEAMDQEGLVVMSRKG